MNYYMKRPIFIICLGEDPWSVRRNHRFGCPRRIGSQAAANRQLSRARLSMDRLPLFTGTAVNGQADSHRDKWSGPGGGARMSEGLSLARR